MNLLFTGGIPQDVAGANLLILPLFSTRVERFNMTVYNKLLICQSTYYRICGEEKPGCFVTHAAGLHWVYRVIIVC
jgi:hypothetical protein